ncbi:MAG: prolyl oligopeptidase family serine peptidase [Niabella sp.]
MPRIVYFFFILILSTQVSVFAQVKKPLTHDVYDGWKSLSERKISDDGRFIYYAINPQQGDGVLYVQSTADTSKKILIPRGYAPLFTLDASFLIAKVKPLYADTREAKIKKKKPDEMPRDSMVIVRLDSGTMNKIPNLQSFKMPEKSSQWLAYHLAPISEASKKSVKKDSTEDVKKIADSIVATLTRDLKRKVPKAEVVEIATKAAKEIYESSQKNNNTAKGNATGGNTKPNAGKLVLRDLIGGSEKEFPLVAEYMFDKQGNRLLYETAKDAKDSNSKAYVVMYDIQKQVSDTIMSGLNEAKNFAAAEDGGQWAFVAERDSSEKSLQKFYKLWYYKPGNDSAVVIADRATAGIRKGFTVSDDADLKFSKDGKKLFFGVAPIRPPKDTTLVDFETARLDVWHYNDDYIQPQQLKQLPRESKRSYLTVFMPDEKKVLQLGDEDAENISLVDEGNADWVLAQSTKGNRVEASWEGQSKKNVYVIEVKTGKRKTVATNSYGFYQASPNGKYVIGYLPDKKYYALYDVANGRTTNISQSIPQPLYDIENDVPDFPRQMGIEAWLANDEYVLIKSYYDIWKIPTSGNNQPVNITASGKLRNMDFDVVRLDDEKRFYEATDTLLLIAQNRADKSWSLFSKELDNTQAPSLITAMQKSINGLQKAKNANMFCAQLADIRSSELFVGNSLSRLAPLTDVTAQQKPYNWLTAELVHWKMFDGKMSEGILYKPEDFDPNKKYPVIFYFYEKNADGLFSYKAPAPSASTINIPYFVSNGYLVFDPNIYYKTGQPGESAYNSVVSAAKYLSKMPWVDAANMGIQGQSWGGYQVAYLVTRTNMFKAAGAGAPVSNMTSAYGGIRWGSGMVRQFQYEKTQSRIGATLWEQPDLYLKNSPLFAADKVQTPLLIMHNDADGAVPWYQGIEYYSALRRLHKKVWLLEYNDEDHNLVERRNRKDLSIRLSQFFDYYLKGAKPASWIVNGVPAIDKGISWGLETVEE